MRYSFGGAFSAVPPVGKLASVGKISCAALIAALAAPLAPSAVALQDIAEMTGTEIQPAARWVVRLETVKRGSVHVMGAADAGKVDAKAIDRVLAVRTSDDLHLLDASHSLGTGRPMVVNTAMKGPRLVTAKVAAKRELKKAAVAMVTAKPLAPQADTIGSGTPTQNEIDPVVTGGSGTLMASAGTSQLALAAARSQPGQRPAAEDPSSAAKAHLLAMATTFRMQQDGLSPFPEKTEKNDSLAGIHPAVAALLPQTDALAKAHGRSSLSGGQMKQARAAARQMAKIVDQMRAKQTGNGTSQASASTLSAYAPQEASIASAFASVLNDNPTGTKNSLIKLAKKDHAWAAFPLPKSSFSNRQRRCLTAGIYFEARGEPILGQKAVAQVILNRVRNPKYPDSICGVVYQHKHKRNRCQFSFACDGIKDRIASPKHWEISKRVANEAIDGRFWLKSVGSASHYHADYVWPRWGRTMHKMTKIGRHIFYRTYGGGWS